MQEMRALLIEWEGHTGKRAGNIDPRDEKLRCNNWQNMEKEPNIELRLVEDSRDISRYKKVKGVTVLIGKDAINEAIEANFPPKITIEDKLIYEEHVKEQIREKKIKFKDLKKDRKERLKQLKDDYGIMGIAEVPREKV